MFDPNLPQAGTEIDAVQMRSQLNGLKAIIDAVPGLTDVVIDAVTTLPPGDPATVTASVIGTVLHLSFGIPAGNEGQQGDTGEQGPPFATVVVAGVNTLPPGTPATVDADLVGNAVELTFGIPQGETGAQGAQGLQGDVSLTQLDNAIATTSSNSNAVNTLDTPFADADAEQLRQRFNELVLALRR